LSLELKRKKYAFPRSSDVIETRGIAMVGLTNPATVTFVPFFAPAPASLLVRPEQPTTARAELDHAQVGQAVPERIGRESDRIVALRVAHALAELQVPILRTLEISVVEGHVTLRGRVRTYYERQLAHAHARRTPGVVTVRGEISVAE